MTDNNIEKDDVPKKQTLQSVAKKAKAAGEGVASVADTANNAFSAIKWVAIAVVFSITAFGGWAVYKVVSAPAKAVGNMAEGAAGAMKSGAGSVKEGASGIVNRLVIPTSDQAKLDALSHAAFEALTNTAVSAPTGMKDRVFRTKNFPGSEGQLCSFSAQLGGNPIPVFAAADNKGYATAKSLGAKSDRIIRILIRAEGDDIALLTEWDDETSAWVMKWKASTIKKSLSDTDAASRLKMVLSKVATDCG